MIQSDKARNEKKKTAADTLGCEEAGRPLPNYLTDFLVN